MPQKKALPISTGKICLPLMLSTAAFLINKNIQVNIKQTASAICNRLQTKIIVKLRNVYSSTPSKKYLFSGCIVHFY